MCTISTTNPGFGHDSPSDTPTDSGLRISATSKNGPKTGCTGNKGVRKRVPIDSTTDIAAVIDDIDNLTAMQRQTIDWRR